MMIIKASGEQALFDPMKIKLSLNRVGADAQLIEQIVQEVSQSLTPNMTTREIYHIAFKLLRKKSRILAAKYHLKRAIMQLGLSGYPFEKYFSELLKHRGFKTQNNQIVNGFCINHEVDVVAHQNNKIAFIECKYHNRLGITCDVKVALYFKARFIDIEKAHQKQSNMKLEGWLVTNTRFTSDALKYGICAGLHLISWDFPQIGSLKEQIEVSGLYPITCITNLTKAEMVQLLQRNIILCKTINQNPALLDPLNLPVSRKNSIIFQCQNLCSRLS